MKFDKLLTALWGFLLAFLLSFACMACVASAFAEEISVDLMKLAFWCAAFSLIAAVCFTFRMELLFVNIALVGLLLACKYTELIDVLKSLLQNLSELFHQGYGWGSLSWDVEDVLEHTLALQAIGSLSAASVAWTVCRKRLCIWAIAGVLIPFLPCTFMLMTVPDVRYLFLMIFALVLLLMTQSTRRRKESEGNKLTAILILPTVLAVIALFAFVPQDGYAGRERADELLTKFEDLFNFTRAHIGAYARQEKRVDLTDVGEQKPSNAPVMDVFSPQSEAMYLRGHAYDTYDGTSWSDSGVDSGLPWKRCYFEPETLKIHMRRIEPYALHPYRLDSWKLAAADRGLENETEEKDFVYGVYFDEYYKHGHYLSESYMEIPTNVDELMVRMTQLPAKTRKWAENIWKTELQPELNKEFYTELSEELNTECYTDLSEELNTAITITFQHSEYYYANLIEKYLSQKKYSLGTEKMPDEFDDFAQWFTEESPTGYCVHFATAATVLLRANGIPARYVTGYYAQVEADQKTTIYGKSAHAWVEYWDPELGWLVFDPTPSDEVLGITASTESTATEPTEPITTERPTLKEEPTEPTEMTERPSKPRPTMPNESEVPTQTKEEPFVLPESVWWILLSLAVTVLILAQSRVRVYLKRRSLSKGTNNERALKIWKMLKRCHAAELPTELAQKARFSNHELAQEELKLMLAYMENSIEALRNRPWYRKIIDRIILALY